MNTMKFGKKYSFGDVVLASVQFTDSNEIKTRPAMALFEEYGNIVVMGITSNPHMKGILLTKAEGMEFDSIIKLNYVFTITEMQIKKDFFSISEDKKKLIKDEIISRLK